MRRNEQFILRRAADMIVIVPVGKEAVRFPGMISVNETGGLLWELLREEQTAAALAAAMAERFCIPQEQAEADVEAFLEKLLAVGAVCADDT